METDITISRAVPGDAEAVSRFAEQVWWEHYRGIVPDGQIDYMLKTFQSPGAIAADMEKGYTYYTAKKGGKMAGYCAACPQGIRVFLSKLYVDAENRGTGLGRAMLNRVLEDLCPGKRDLYLHVNRGNTDSIAAYEHMGFYRDREQNGDIGGGYFTEDYVMVLPLPIEKPDIRAVIFDMDGLLFDTEKLYLLAWPAVLNPLGYFISEEAVLSTMGIAHDESEEIFKAHCGPSFSFDETLPLLSKWIDDYIAEHGIPVQPGARDLLAWLKMRDIPVSLGSSNYRRYVDDYLRAADMLDQFDAVVCADTVGAGKPEPDIFLECARQMGHPPENCLVLEDSPAGILAARRAGCVPAMVPDLIQPDQVTLSRLWRCFGSLEEVPAALAQLGL